VGDEYIIEGDSIVWVGRKVDVGFGVCVTVGYCVGAVVMVTVGNSGLNAQPEAMTITKYEMNAKQLTKRFKGYSIHFFQSENEVIILINPPAVIHPILPLKTKIFHRVIGALKPPML
jgi:hypothetical protein